MAENIRDELKRQLLENLKTSTENGIYMNEIAMPGVKPDKVDPNEIDSAKE